MEKFFRASVFPHVTFGLDPVTPADFLELDREQAGEPFSFTYSEALLMLTAL